MGAVPGHERVRNFFDTRSYLARNAIIPVRADLVTELLAEISDSEVLDLGCGDGSISRPLLASGNRLTLVDFSRHMLERARAHADAAAPVTFVQADILDFVAPEPYDAVICVGVLAHVSSVEQAIARVSSTVRPGGLCVLQTTDDASVLGRLLNHYYRWRGKQGYELNTLTLSELEASAGRYGLVSLRTRRYGLLWPGLGRLPDRWEFRIESAVASSRNLSRLGAEVLVCFQRS